MATEPTAQRAYRAACPNCGAPVEFASAASASAVCGFCRSTLVRDGDALTRIGESGDLFDDHSPLQLGVQGRHQGVAFSLIGRLQYGYDGGTWNEWHALFDSGKSGWLSEDNGAYVFSFDQPEATGLPVLASLVVGARCQAAGRAWDVASVTRAKLLAAQGELPSAPRLQGEFGVADLRNEQGEVATLDERDSAHPSWAVGRSVALSELTLSGLRQGSEKTLKGRSLECPSCGNALALTLASTKSVACGQCHAVVDVSQGVGGQLAHFAQNNSGVAGAEPQLPLGRSGRLDLGGGPLAWQVVGYMERCNLPSGGDDEQVFWREYLLYNELAGFAFLVDAEDGWSVVRPLTGAPSQRGSQALWLGDTYIRKEAYRAKVTWVLGEFYWRVQREEVAQVADYQGFGSARQKRLSREQVANEVTWSAGSTLDAATVADAFGIAPANRAALQRDAGPLASSGRGSGLGTGIIVFLVLVLVIILVAKCSGDDCANVRDTFGEASAEYQQCARSGGSGVRSSGGSYGGSYGGYSSSGGGHK